MRRRDTTGAFVPFVGHNSFRQGAGPPPVFVVVAQVGDGYFCVEYQLGVGQVVAFSVKWDQFPGRYRKLEDAVAPQVKSLVDLAKKHGATLEAIQLLGVLTPLTKEDETTMAQAKLSKASGDKAGLKDAAKKAPVGGAKAKGAGNTAALTAAREQKASANDAKKIKVLKKENPYREGTKAAATYELLRGCATVADAKAKATSDHDLGYIRYASRDGHISLT